jgi:hypothetical protein
MVQYLVKCGGFTFRNSVKKWQAGNSLKADFEFKAVPEMVWDEESGHMNVWISSSQYGHNTLFPLRIQSSGYGVCVIQCSSDSVCNNRNRWSTNISDYQVCFSCGSVRRATYGHEIYSLNSGKLRTMTRHEFHHVPNLRVNRCNMCRSELSQMGRFRFCYTLNFPVIRQQQV